MAEIHVQQIEMKNHFAFYLSLSLFFWYYSYFSIEL